MALQQALPSSGGENDARRRGGVPAASPVCLRLAALNSSRASVVSGNAFTYSRFQPHALITAWGNSYGYDANGNQTARMIGGYTYTFTYDRENHLTEVKQGSTVLATYAYDAAGTRVRSTVGGVTTIYVNGIYEYVVGSGATTKYDEGGVLRRTGYAADNGVFYLLKDQLGSSSSLLTSTGALAPGGRAYYTPYGAARSGQVSLTTRRFTGQYHETTLPGGAGLYDYGARWYDPRVGRRLAVRRLARRRHPSFPSTFFRLTTWTLTTPPPPDASAVYAPLCAFTAATCGRSGKPRRGPILRARAATLRQ